MKVTIIRRDHANLEITLTDVDGNAVDLTGGTLFFTVKNTIDDVDDDALISKEITTFSAPTTGVATVTLTPTETDLPAGNYFYDVQFKSSGNVISSSFRDYLVVKPDVTIRTT